MRGGQGVSTRAGAGELMGQRAKRTTTVTVDLGDLKALWQAWCQAHGITPSHAMDRKATRAPAPLGCASRRSENERPLASN